MTDVFFQQEKKGTKWLQWEGENSTLTDGFSKGWLIKILLAWETLNIFLLKKINTYLFYSNIHNKFASKAYHATLK